MIRPRKGAVRDKIISFWTPCFAVDGRVCTVTDYNVNLLCMLSGYHLIIVIR
jgi:hypothetical protein